MFVKLPGYQDSWPKTYILLTDVLTRISSNLRPRLGNAALSIGNLTLIKRNVLRVCDKDEVTAL
jgi:hypothetical protein